MSEDDKLDIAFRKLKKENKEDVISITSTDVDYETMQSEDSIAAARKNMINAMARFLDSEEIAESFINNYNVSTFDFGNGNVFVFSPISLAVKSMMPSEFLEGHLVIVLYTLELLKMLRNTCNLLEAQYDNNIRSLERKRNKRYRDVYLNNINGDATIKTATMLAEQSVESLDEKIDNLKTEKKHRMADTVDDIKHISSVVAAIRGYVDSMSYISPLAPSVKTEEARIFISTLVKDAVNR